MDLQRPKILVTGANGQLASEIKVLESSYPHFDFYFFGRKDLPIDNTKIVEQIFSEKSFKYCINCAAYTAVDKAESEKEQAFLINATAVGNLAKICKKYEVKFIHISTDYVYDDSIARPLNEEDNTLPKNVYGASKLEGERLALNANPDSVIVRTSWVYSSFGNNFIKTMLRLFKEKQEINVVSDQFGSPTYAADLADMLMQIIVQMEAGKAFHGVYNYSNEGITNWFKFASEIKKRSNASCIIHPIPTSAYPTPAARPFYSVMDTSKIKKETGISIPQWESGVARCLKILQAF